MDGESTSGDGVAGESGTGIGVSGLSGTGDVVHGESNSGIGVSGSSVSSVGVFGESVDGIGGHFGGGLAPLSLDPSQTPGPPQTGDHNMGEFFVDSNGVLYFCVQSGRRFSWSSTFPFFIHLSSLRTASWEGNK